MNNPLDRFNKILPSIDLQKFTTTEEVDEKIHTALSAAEYSREQRELYYNHLIRLRCADLITGIQYKSLTSMLRSVDHENVVVAQTTINTLLRDLD